MIKHYVKLDLSKRDERKIISVSKSDQNSHKIIFTLTNGATPVTLPPDADAWVNVRGSGSPVEKAEVFPADNTIEYTPTSKAFTSSGFVVCYLQISDTVGRILYSPSFYLYIEESGKDILDVFNEAATSSNAGAQIAAILKSAIDVLGTEGDNVQTHAENAEDSAQNSQKSAENASKAEQAATEAKNEAEKITEEFQETLNLNTVGKSIKLEMDSKTHILRLKLLGENDRVLSEQQVDLPLESCVVGVDDFVDSAGKHWLRLTLQNGVQRNVELDAIFANMQQKLNAKQDKLPVNTGGSSNRVWAATPNQYNGGTGILIGTATFSTTPTLQGDTPIITNTAIPSNDYSYAIVARVAELYIMAGDDGTPNAYAHYIKAKASGKKVSFYWTYPYYFKRIIAGSQGKDASTATASGPYVGCVTLKNYFTKWAHGDINATTPYSEYATEYRKYLRLYYQYHVCGIGEEPTLATPPKYSIFGVADNEEPLGETIAVRTAEGNIVVESSDFPFHAVNNQKLEERLGEEIEKVNEDISTVNPFRFSSVYPTAEQAATEDMSGWYRIAKTSTLTGWWSNLFHVIANCRRSTLVTDVIFSAQRLDYSSEPKIAILSTSSKRQDDPVLTNIRIVCTRPNDPDYATECYLDVYMSRSPYGEGAWEDGTAKYDFTVETLFNNNSSKTYKWTLLQPTLVSSEIEEPWISYEKSPLTSAWSQVTASVDDINNLARKDYVNEKIAGITGGGAIQVTDDGNGNITLTTQSGGTVSLIDDGEGNLTLEVI